MSSIYCIIDARTKGHYSVISTREMGELLPNFTLPEFAELASLYTSKDLSESQGKAAVGCGTAGASGIQPVTHLNGIPPLRSSGTPTRLLPLSRLQSTDASLMPRFLMPMANL